MAAPPCLPVAPRMRMVVDIVKMSVSVSADREEKRREET